MKRKKPNGILPPSTWLALHRYQGLVLMMQRNPEKFDHIIRDYMLRRTLLTNDQILQWSDDFFSNYGRYPRRSDGVIDGTNETWSSIESALSSGNRGLAGGSSLVRLLEEHRGVRNKQNLPDLTINQILQWADDFFVKHDRYPKHNDGQIDGTNETWKGIAHALAIGYRGLNGNSSLPRILEEHRGVRNHLNLPCLSINQILQWADDFFVKYGRYPKRSDGFIDGTKEVWDNINQGLERGGRGLPGGSSLAKLLQVHRGVKNHLDQPFLNIHKILKWIDEFFKKYGRYPQCNKDGQIDGTNETWHGIHSALYKGYRGFPGGSSLSKIIKEINR